MASAKWPPIFDVLTKLPDRQVLPELGCLVRILTHDRQSRKYQINAHVDMTRRQTDGEVWTKNILSCQQTFKTAPTCTVSPYFASRRNGAPVAI